MKAIVVDSFTDAELDSFPDTQLVAGQSIQIRTRLYRDYVRKPSSVGHLLYAFGTLKNAEGQPVALEIANPLLFVVLGSQMWVAIPIFVDSSYRNWARFYRYGGPRRQPIDRLHLYADGGPEWQPNSETTVVFEFTDRGGVLRRIAERHVRIRWN
jgi:hypothetical protein